MTMMFYWLQRIDEGVSWVQTAFGMSVPEMIILGKRVECK